MLAVILNMVDVDFVGGMHRQLTRNSDQGEVIGNQEAAKIKQHVVVRAQANQVVVGVGPVVWGTQRSDMRGLCVRSTQLRPTELNIPGRCSHNVP